MPNRPKDFSVTATAPAADDFQMIDGATNGTRKLSAQHGANTRNALAPRGGLAFDGTAGTRATSILTGQVLGTDPHSVAVTFEVPSSNPSAYRGIFIVSSDPASWVVPNAWQVGISSAGVLTVEKRNAASSNGRSLSVAGFVASYGGKIVNMVLVRNGSATPTIYVNGVSQTVSLAGDATVDWGSTTPSTYLTLGIIQSGGEFVGKIYSATLYNLALTQADVTEIYELGGAAPERFKFGSQANLLSGDTANFAGGTAGAWVAVAGGSIAIVANKLQYTHPSGAAYGIQAPFALAGGKAFRIKFTHRLVSGVAVVGGVGLTGSGTPGVPTWASTGTVTQYDNVGIMSTNPDGALYMLATGSGTGEVYEFDDFSVTRVGAVCHLRLSDGIGRVLRDSSTNKLHALRTVAGVSDVIELDDGLYPQLALTANGELLDTAGVLRTDAVLVDVVVKNTTANAVTAFGIGMSSGVRNLTYETNIPANSTVILPINRSDLAGLTVGTAPYGRVYYSAASWNSGSLNLAIRYRRERDL